MKKTTNILILFLVLSFVLAGCSNNSQPANESNSTEQQNHKSEGMDDDYVVKLSYSGSLCQAPAQLAYELGYFKEEGINIEFVKSEQAASDLMVSGQLDVYQEMIPKIIQQVDNGLDIKVASGVHTGCLKVLTLADNNEINPIKDLKGKKIGVPGVASSQAIIVQRTLMEYGIGATPENMEVEFITFNASDLQMALENGSVDAISLGDPSASQIAESGVGKLIFNQATDPLYENEYCCAFVFSPEFAEEHADLAAKTLKALQKACMYVDQHPEEAAQIQVDKAYVAGDPKLNAKLLESYNYRPSIEGGKEALKENILDLQKLGMISNDLEADAVVDKIYIEFEDVDEVSN